MRVMVYNDAGELVLVSSSPPDNTEALCPSVEDRAGVMDVLSDAWKFLALDAQSRPSSGRSHGGGPLAGFFRLFMRGIHQHDDPWSEAPAWAIELRHMLGLVIRKMEIEVMASTDIKAKLEQVAASQAEETNVLVSFLAYVATMQTELSAIKSATTDEATAAALDALNDGINANKAKMAAAMVVGTPQAAPDAAPVDQAAAEQMAQDAIAAAG